MKEKRKELKLSIDHPALVLFDNFKAQCTSDLLTVLDNNNINVILIPANCTDRSQPLYISINKAVKDFYAVNFKHGFLSKWKVNYQVKQPKLPLIFGLVL